MKLIRASMIANAFVWLFCLMAGLAVAEKSPVPTTVPTTVPSTVPSTPSIPSFPGAEGAGALTVGGRMGSVYQVTNLNASGPGSLADAVSQPNRIVVFAVSGTIDLGGGKEGKHGKILIDQPHITIAGQTAPGEGICLKNGAMEITAGDVIVRYIRSRRGYVTDSDTGDAFDIKPGKTEVAKSGEGMDAEHFEKVKAKKESRGKVMKVPARIDNIMLDHLSASWATDENLTVTHANNSTVQYCIAAEGLDYTNPKQTPPNHSEGSLWGVAVPEGHSTMHHMLYAHNRLRNPRTTGGTKPPAVLEFFNNVVYDCSEYTSHTGSEAVFLNWRDNYYKPGPSTPITLRPVMFTFAHSPESRMFATGNVIDGFAAGTEDNWQAVRFEKGLSADDGKKMRADKVFDGPAVNPQKAHEAYEKVLAEGGASLPARDSVDLRLINDVRNGTGHVINKETDLSATDRWPTYHSLPVPHDSNRDGIPDYWKSQFGLNMSKPGDAMKIVAGYTNIEHYFNNTDPTGGTTPIIYIHATISRAHRNNSSGENSIPGELTVARQGDLRQPLKVKYAIEGNAAVGLDYKALTGSVTIPAGEQSAVITVTPVGSRTGAEEKTVVIRLEVPAESNYHVGCPQASLVVIQN